MVQLLGISGEPGGTEEEVRDRRKNSGVCVCRTRMQTEGCARDGPRRQRWSHHQNQAALRPLAMVLTKPIPQGLLTISPTLSREGC